MSTLIHGSRDLHSQSATRVERTTLVVIAKEPLPGRVKTRLHPAISYEAAARVAAASLADTLDAVAWLPARRRILAFDGDPAHVPLAARDYDLIPQGDGPLDERLGRVFDACDGPTLLIGMDTPQVSESHLASAFMDWPDEIDAWFGPTTDGGWWALGLREPDGDLLRGVPTSRADTGVRQLCRLSEAGLRVGMLAPLTDVDEIADADAVARLIPNSRFAASVGDARDERTRALR